MTDSYGFQWLAFEKLCFGIAATFQITVVQTRGFLLRHCPITTYPPKAAYRKDSNTKGSALPACVARPTAASFMEAGFRGTSGIHGNVGTTTNCFKIQEPLNFQSTECPGSQKEDNVFHKEDHRSCGRTPGHIKIKHVDNHAGGNDERSVTES